MPARPALQSWRALRRSRTRARCSTPALAPGASPSHAYLFHGPAGTGKRAVARAFAAALLAQGARSPDAVAERVARDSHPDLTWVTPSGAAEMLVADIEEPVVAAATRTPFESARRVFVIEARRHDERPGGQPHAQDARGAAARSPTCCCSTDRREDVLATIASRCQPVRFDPLPPALIAERPGRRRRASARRRARAWRSATPASRRGSRATRARRCARGAEDYVRSALAGETGRATVDRATGRRQGGGSRRWRARAGARRVELELRAEQGAQTLRARSRRGAAPRRAARAHRHARSRSAPGGAVAARRAVHARRRTRAPLRGRPPRAARAGRATVATRWRCAGASSSSPTRACSLSLNVSEELALEALAYRLQATLAREPVPAG